MLTDNNQIFRNCFVIIYCHLTNVLSQINKCIIFETNELSITLSTLWSCFRYSVVRTHQNTNHVTTKYQVLSCSIDESRLIFDIYPETVDMIPKVQVTTQDVHVLDVELCAKAPKVVCHVRQLDECVLLLTAVN